MATDYYLAPSLKELRDEIDAKWPGRDKRSDGWVGDTSHQARKSDHNPNARRSVNAIDVTSADINATTLINLCKKDDRVEYVIHKRKIYSRVRNFRAKAYDGPNPHIVHVHVSIRQTKTAEQDTRGWGLASTTAPSSKPKPAPKPKPGLAAPHFPLKPDMWFGPESKNPKNRSGYSAADRPHIQRFQQRLRDRGWKIAVTGRFDASTSKIVKAFQKEKKLKADGLVGPATWRAIWEAQVTA